MFGSILDRIFIAFSHRKGRLSSKIIHYSFKNKDAKQNWIYFIPEFCYRFAFLRDKLILKNANIEVYILPKMIIQPNPELTRKFLDKVLKTAIKTQLRNSPDEEVNVLGISTSVAVAFRFAERFKVNKFISVTPGSRLAECIWESIGATYISQNPHKYLKDYQRSLINYNPIESISKINPKISEVYLGKYDVMIPYNRGKELADKMKRNGKTKIFCNQYSGHVETLFYFLKKFSKNAN